MLEAMVVLPPLIRREFFYRHLFGLFDCLLACFVPDVIAPSGRIQAPVKSHRMTSPCPSESEFARISWPDKNKGAGKTEREMYSKSSEIGIRWQANSWAGEGKGQKRKGWEIRLEPGFAGREGVRIQGGGRGRERERLYTYCMERVSTVCMPREP